MSASFTSSGRRGWQQENIIRSWSSRMVCAANASSISGDSVFTLVQPTPAAPECDAGTTCQKTTIDRYPDTALVTVQFVPTNTAIYNATVTIKSNGANDGGTVVIPVTAYGVKPDAG